MSEEKGENSVVNFSHSVEEYEKIQENGQNEDPDSKNYENLSEIDDTYSRKKDIKDLYSDENSKSFTVRELLDREDQEEQNAMENGTQNGGLFTGVTIYQGNNSDNSNKNNNTSQESAVQQATNQQRMAADLLNNVVEGDEEGRSRQRILAFAAKRYASAIERNPNDYDALYNWALVLQECADNVGLEPGSPSKDALLEEACKKYDEATRLCPTLHDAYYNWAIAISDQAKMRGRTKEAENLWKQATRKYEKAVQLNRNSPQALNNWGLALQELSAIVPAREKLQIVKMAVSKFRAAIQLQFDFHRAIYNLGTVLYGLAEDILRSGRSINSKEMSPNELYTQSAVYIAAAHSLRPNYPVYRSALRLVKSMLPLPYLKAGYLIAPPAGDNLAPHSDWKQAQFVLNHEGLYEIADSRSNSDRSAVMMLSNNSSIFKIEIADILSLSPCSDLTLPPGSGFCIETVHGPQYLLAETWESMDCWLDAIRLVYTISARGKSDVLAGVITS